MNAPLDTVREALQGQEAWLVGGAVRDRLLGRDTDDVDVALEGDPRAAAKQIARATNGAHFQLSGAFGAWRVVGREEHWHVDLVPLRDGDIRADLAARDFTINAMAEPLDGGDLLDPHGGREDLAARRLRMVSGSALQDDPLGACEPSGSPSSWSWTSPTTPARPSSSTPPASTASPPSASSAS